MFELHTSMPPSAEYEATIPLKFFRQSTNQFREVVTSLDSINGWSIQTLRREENDSKQSDEVQAIGMASEKLYRNT